MLKVRHVPKEYENEMKATHNLNMSNRIYACEDAHEQESLLQELQKENNFGMQCKASDFQLTFKDVNGGIQKIIEDGSFSININICMNARDLLLFKTNNRSAIEKFKNVGVSTEEVGNSIRFGMQHRKADKNEYMVNSWDLLNDQIDVQIQQQASKGVGGNLLNV